MIQFFWDNKIVNVFKFLCECLDVMLGADSDDQRQILINPRWLQKVEGSSMNDYSGVNHEMMIYRLWFLPGSSVMNKPGSAG